MFESPGCRPASDGRSDLHPSPPPTRVGVGLRSESGCRICFSDTKPLRWDNVFEQQNSRFKSSPGPAEVTALPLHSSPAKTKHMLAFRHFYSSVSLIILHLNSETTCASATIQPSVLFFHDFCWSLSKLTKGCSWHLDNEWKSRQNETDVTWPDLLTSRRCEWLLSQHCTSSLISSNTVEVQWLNVELESHGNQSHPSNNNFGKNNRDFVMASLENKMLWLVHNKSSGYLHCHHAFCF